MTTPTANYAWGKPTPGADADAWGVEANVIFDAQDAQVFANAPRWIAGAGTVDIITAAYSPALTALTDGMLVAFRALGANTSTTPTFSPNGLTARTIVKCGGQALLAGDIPRANYECFLRYNLLNTRWELLNPKTVS